jgi:hypothetical protein
MHIQNLKTLSGNIKIKIPTNLSEVTLGSMIEMQSLADGSNEIPLIPGLTAEIVENIIEYQDLIDIRERILSLAHQIKYCYIETKVPEYITIGTKQVKRFWYYKTVPNRIKVINNLSIEPAGAYLSSRDLIVDEINKCIVEFGEDNWQTNFVPSLDACAGILANYFYCHATGQLWNEQKAEAFKSEILKLSIQDTLPIARFFFRNFNNLYKPKTPLWQVLRQIWKEKLALRRIKNSVI